MFTLQRQGSVLYREDDSKREKGVFNRNNKTALRIVAIHWNTFLQPSAFVLYLSSMSMQFENASVNEKTQNKSQWYIRCSSNAICIGHVGFAIPLSEPTAVSCGPSASDKSAYRCATRLSVRWRLLSFYQHDTQLYWLFSIPLCTWNDWRNCYKVTQVWVHITLHSSMLCTAKWLLKSKYDHPS